MTVLTQKRLFELLDYRPAEGAFYWKARPTRNNASFEGQRAGWLNVAIGYWQIEIEGETLFMHHVVWLAETGVMPEQLDHKDRDRANNVFSNLRLCTSTQNRANMQKAEGQFTSQYKGVSWHKQKQRWAAEIRVNGVKYNLGRHKSEVVAALAYNEAAIKHFGEFARINEVPAHG